MKQPSTSYRLIVSRTDSAQPYPHLAQAGVPFSRGVIKDLNGFYIVDASGRRLTGSVQVTAFWPDGSVQWCLARFLCAGIENSNSEFFLVRSDVIEDVKSGLCVNEDENQIVVSDHEDKYVFSKIGGCIFPDVFVNGKTTLAGSDIDIHLQGVSNQEMDFEKTATVLVQVDSVSACIEIHGLVQAPADRSINLTFRYEVLSGQVLSVVVEVHNPNRAQHSQGIWDLGDPGSFLFSDISLRLKHDQKDKLLLKPVFADDETFNLKTCDKALLFQASSGGENWDSPTHMNAQGLVCNEFCGYRVSVDGDDVAAGARANPLFVVKNKKEKVVYQFAIRDFWQNFPKSIALSDTRISIGLFPQEHKAGYELQGGERKRHTIFFSFNQNKDALDWVNNSTVIVADADTVKKSSVLAIPLVADYKPYDDLLSVSLDESRGIKAKREAQDEYGWRNFGDVVADHETLYHKDDGIFVSHYNNQYDAVYGFARQFLSTADHRWFCLMDDLARHVLDIDIYRTTKDRDEYNHGLFWHTDHYLQAFTCSHRTYSRSHYEENWKGDKGGGPGAEHCYTTGLKLYYYLTGDLEAKTAVVGLASWIRYYYEGSGTVLENCKSLVSKDLPQFLLLCKGQKVFRYRYGFDRGTGNYIRALLDSYELTLDSTYLAESEAIIMSTFGSTDDIALRDLGNVEYTWFYTVFLQEVIRYLELKLCNESIDEYFYYSRDALLHYANWMVVHEQPALTCADALDHPNDTWVAQDIRKANVLYAAYKYAITNRESYLYRAREFRDYVIESLGQSETLHFSRIQILLLQNHGPSGSMESESEILAGLKASGENSLSGTPCFLHF